MKYKILFLLSFHHDASSRFRVEAYKSMLEKDYDISIYYISQKPKFMPKFLKSLYKKSLLLYLAITSSKYDAVFIHRAVSSYKNSLWFEKILKKFNENIIFDFDDAIFMHNEQKISGIISTSKYSICGNNYLKEYSSRYNPNSFVIPTCSNTDIFVAKKNQDNTKLTIGWTGTSSNYQFFSTKLIAQISKILKEYPSVEFLFICDSKPDARFNFNYEFIKWSETNEVSDIQNIDIGLMPLDDSEWTKGKCGFKLIQYGAIAIPSLSSNVGVNPDIITDGINGYIVDNDQWYEKIQKLVLDKELRKTMGERARENVELNYSLKANYQKLKELIDSCIN